MDKYGRQKKFGVKKNRISRKSTSCPRGYTMNPINGNCQESVSIYQSQQNNNFPILTRDVPDCCSQPNSYGKCWFGCVPCSQMHQGMWEWSPGDDCFQITATEDCPAGSEMYAGVESYINDDGVPDTRPIWTSFMSDACMYKLEMMKNATAGTCPDVYGHNNGYVNVNCSCWAFNNYECPGQEEPAGCTNPDDPNYSQYALNDNGCAPPKQEFMRGGRIGRNRESGLRTRVRIEDDSGRLIPSIRRQEGHGYGGNGNQVMAPCDDCSNDNDCHATLCCNRYGPDNCKMCGYCGGGGGGSPDGPSGAPPKFSRKGGMVRQRRKRR